jgi:hypothetical protein
MCKQWFVWVVIACLVAVASCGPSPQKGTITLETEIDFSAEPYSGTFEVTEGAELLGCVSGSLVVTTSASSDFKELRCESGERSGTFTIEFNPPNVWMAEWTGPWTVKEGTDDFSGLSGGGELQAIIDLEDQSGVEIHTGEIEHSN